jgi:uncharacterized protein YgiM (DUF1202 family)
MTGPGTILRVASAVVLVLGTVGGAASTSSAQEAGRDKTFEELDKDLANLNRQLTQIEWRGPLGVASVVPTKRSVPVKAGADETSRILFTVTQGQDYPVVDKVGSWYAIEAAGGKYGWVKASDVVPKATFSPSGPPSTQGTEGLLAQEAEEIRQRYKNNPYVFVKGFNVALGLSGPSLSLSFEFK